MDNDLTVYIYVLIDPRDGEIRYVGWCKNLKTRLIDHCCPSKLKPNNYKNNWIKNLKNDGFKPEIWPIQIIPYSEKDYWERWWISYFKSNGFRLTNGTDGGEGMLGNIPSLETKNKISKSNKGKPKTEKEKQQISESKKGKRMSAVARKNMSEGHKGKPSGKKGIKDSEETKKKKSIAMSKPRGSYTSERKDNISKSKLGRKNNSFKNTSKYVGVCWVKTSNKWRASITVNRKQIFLGYFDNEVEAAKAYNNAAIKYFGENAKLNTFE